MTDWQSGSLSVRPGAKNVLFASFVQINSRFQKCIHDVIPMSLQMRYTTKIACFVSLYRTCISHWSRWDDERERERGEGTEIFVYTSSLHYPSFLGSFAKHIFFGNVWYFLGSFHAKKAFYLPSRCWLYTLSITKLNHVSVLCLSCLMLDQDWIRHPHTSFRPRRITRTFWLNNFGSTICVEI